MDRKQSIETIGYEDGLSPKISHLGNVKLNLLVKLGTGTKLPQMIALHIKDSQEKYGKFLPVF